MGIFGKLFKKKPKLEPVDLSLLKTDLHSHLIPGIDDGSKSIEESLAMLKRFSELGYKKVITTPHVMSDFYKNTPAIILDGLEKVKEAIKGAGIPIQIEAAAEYYLDEHFEKLIAEKSLLTFGDNHVLFELSFVDEPARIKEAIFNLVTEGYKPILAHVERYPYYINKLDALEDFKRRGCLLQLNINSLSGHYGPQVKKWAQEVIDKDLIDVVGSDCHHMGHLEMLSALRTNEYEHKVVNNKTLINSIL